MIAMDIDRHLRLIAAASLVTSFALFAAAWLDLQEAFYLLVVVNFAFLHAIWIVQALEKQFATIDWKPFRAPLIAFGASGCAAALLFHPEWLGL